MGKPPGFPPLFRIPPWLPYRILCAKANSNQGVALSSFPRVNKAKSHVTERWRHDDPDDLAACLHRLATDWPASSAMWVRAFSDRFTNLCSRIESVKEFWRSCGEVNQPTCQNQLLRRLASKCRKWLQIIATISTKKEQAGLTADFAFFQAAPFVRI